MGAWRDLYTVDEAAQILRLSPARVRQMLRSSELEGERKASHLEGVLGPWRVDGGSLRRTRERWDAVDSEETVAMTPDEAPAAVLSAETPGVPSGNPPRKADDTPSAAAEQLSESVRKLRETAERLLQELGGLEGRLEAAEIQEAALRASARREKERADRLASELEAERSRPGEERRSGWRRLLGG